jgi:peptide/nickel transport system ATP-binding protein
MVNVENLNVQFLNQEDKSLIKAVKNVNLKISKGKVLGIVGESGSGKSVTSFSIMRLLDESTATITGKIEFNNINLLDLSSDQMRAYRGNKISMIFQEPMTSLNPVFTCGNQVREAILLHQKTSKEEAKSRTLALFREVQLPRPEHIYESYPHQLSGGQKQRVMIAMALSCNPDLLIADEPTTALDVTVQKMILELLLRIKEERQMAMIFISHDLAVIHDIADEVAVMYKGDIVEQGPAADIFSNPEHPYTRGLLACRPNPEKLAKKLPIVADFLKTDLTSDAFKLEQYTHGEIRSRRIHLYSQEPILEVKNLNTWFPVKQGMFGRTRDYVKAVNDISLEVYPGETRKWICVHLIKRRSEKQGETSKSFSRTPTPL